MFAWDVVTLLKCVVSSGVRTSGFVYLMLEMCTDSPPSSVDGNSCQKTFLSNAWFGCNLYLYNN